MKKKLPKSLYKKNRPGFRATDAEWKAILDNYKKQTKKNYVTFGRWAVAKLSTS